MTDRSLLGQLKAAARTTSSLIALGVEPGIVRTKNLLRLPFNIPSGEAVAYLSPTDGGIELNMRANHKAGRQELRRVLLGAARLVATPSEHHLLARFEADTPARRIMKSASAWIQTVQQETELRHELHRGTRQPGGEDSFGFWADVRANFGDQIGPWLVQELSGRRMINSRYSTRDHGRMTATVGSIIHMLPTSATSRADI